MVDRTLLTDNLMRFSSIPFTRNGTTGTEDLTNLYSLISVSESATFDTDSLKSFSNIEIIPFGRRSNFTALVERKIEKEDQKEAAKKSRKRIKGKSRNSP